MSDVINGDMLKGRFLSDQEIQADGVDVTNYHREGVNPAQPYQRNDFKDVGTSNNSFLVRMRRVNQTVEAVTARGRVVRPAGAVHLRTRPRPQAVPIRRQPGIRLPTA